MEHANYRVLIVDDEYRIAMLIKKLIHWEELQLEFLAVADNGLTALEIIQTQKPDILITDIRMPQIDGLELIKQAKVDNPSMKTIIVSGYREFEYAQKAIAYGVGNYLVKPINEEALNDTLKKLCLEYQDYQETVQLKKTVSKSEHIIKRDILSRMIEGEELPAESEQFLKSGIYTCLDVKLDYNQYDAIDRQHESQIVEHLRSLVEDAFSSIADPVFLCKKDELNLYVLLCFQEEQRADIRETVGNVLLQIQNYLLESGIFTVTIGIGEEQDSTEKIRHCIKGAYQAVENRIRQGTGRLIYEHQLPHTAIETPVVLSDDLQTIIDTYSEVRMSLLIEAMYEPYMQGAELDYSECYRMARELVKNFYAILHLDDSENCQMILVKIQHCNTINRLKRLLQQDLGNELQQRKTAQESESIRPVRQAKQYIEEHFSEKIVLEDIAEVVGLNPVYFSVLFKKETDMNFSAYLLHIRMEKAKALICSSNETIAAIAEKVGYKDSRYFSQCFEKSVGVKPALYRRLHS